MNDQERASFIINALRQGNAAAPPGAPPPTALGTGPMFENALLAGNPDANANAGNAIADVFGTVATPAKAIWEALKADTEAQKAGRARVPGPTLHPPPCRKPCGGAHDGRNKHWGGACSNTPLPARLLRPPSVRSRARPSRLPGCKAGTGAPRPPDDLATYACAAQRVPNVG